MTVPEFTKAFKGALKDHVKEYEIVARNVHAERSDRIFIEGGLGDKGNEKFQYSTKPIQAGEDAFAFPGSFVQTGFQGFNKAQRSKSGKKGYYFMELPGGYKQLKSVQGMQSGFVDLNYEGDLFYAFRNGFRKKNQKSFFVFLPITERQKMGYAIDKYGDFTGYNETEFESLRIGLSEALVKSLKNRGID